MKLPFNCQWLVMLALLLTPNPGRSDDSEVTPKQKDERVELSFGKLYIPKNLKAGEIVHLNKVHSARVNARGGLTVSAKEVVREVEVLEVVIVEKPANPFAAVKVSVRANPDQTLRLTDVAKGALPLQLVRKNPAKEAVVKPELTSTSLAKWGNAKAVFTARVIRPVSIPGLSGPLFEIEIDQVLMGDAKKGEHIRGVEILVLKDKSFDAGHWPDVLISQERGRFSSIRAVELTDDQTLAQARLAIQIPVGWTFRDDWLVSPWAHCAEGAWPPSQVQSTALSCADTGRPALLAGTEIEFGAEAIVPDGKKETKPDGEGEFRVWLRNPTNKSIEVPALLCNGRGPLWNESLVVVGTGTSVGRIASLRTMVFLESNVGSEPVRGTVVGPGETISGVVDVRKVPGLLPPFGSAQMNFEFVLGERRVPVNFHFSSRSSTAGGFRGRGVAPPRAAPQPVPSAKEK